MRLRIERVCPPLAVAALLAVLVWRSTAAPAGPSPRAAASEREAREEAAAPSIPPASAAAAPGRPSRPEKGAQEILALLLERRARKTPGPSGPRAYSGFGYEKILCLTEGRLLARLYPEECEPLASALAFDPSRPAADRQYGIRLLGFLAESGRSGAAAQLLRLGRDEDRDIRELAVHALAPADRAGTFRAFYADQCRDANRAAFKAMSCLGDSATLLLMQELRNGESGPIRGEQRMMAEDVIRKAELLSAPDWSSRLEEILGKGGHPDQDRWALAAARALSLPNLQDVLRRRLDLDMAAARKKDAYWREINEKEELPASPAGFEERYVTHVGSDVVPDFAHDDLLLAYRQLGGTPTDLERRRLEEFGFEGDAETALRRFLSAEQ